MSGADKPTVSIDRNGMRDVNMRAKLIQRETYPLGSAKIGELEVRGADGELQYSLDLVWFQFDGPDFVCAGRSVVFMRMVQLLIHPAAAVEREMVRS